VDTHDRVGGNDITDPDLINHAADEGSGPTPTPLPPTATPIPGGVFVNQVCPFSSPGEYVELYNSGSTEVNLNGWKLNVYSGDYTFTSVDVIPAMGYYLIADKSTVSGITPDVFTNIGITDNGTNSFAQLLDNSAQVVDTVGWANASLYEGTKLGTLPSSNAWLRNFDGVDTDDNASDFSAMAPDPRNSSNSAPPTSTPTPTPVPATNTPIPTNTPVPPTNTPIPPTNTPVPPTNTPIPPTNTPSVNAEIVINQVCPFSSPGEYVELYNNGTSDFNLNGWKLNVYSGDYTFTSMDVIPAGGYYLISDTNPVVDITADVVAGIGITDNGTNSFAQLIDDAAQVVDTVGWSSASLFEGTKLGSMKDWNCMPLPFQP